MAAPFPTDDTPAACGPTLAAVQAVLDGDRPAAALDADPHATGCPACRGRVADARVLLAALAESVKPVAVPPGFTAHVLAAVRVERRTRTRRRFLLTVGGGLAVAAAVLVAAFVLKPLAPQQVVERSRRVAPAREPTPPVNVTAELAKAGDAFRGSSLPLAGPAAAAPKVLATLAESLFPPMPAPTGEDVAPVGASLAELPTAATAGLEPVTGTTQKAFNRFLRDVGLVSTVARPKS